MCHRPRLSLHGLSIYVSKDERTKKNSSEADLGLPQPMILRSNHASVKLLMSLRDVWCQLNSVRPLFGSLVGHKDAPPGGAFLQATLEVVAGLTELS